ncbi:hypothetical protein NicSoilB4_17680 [Arthrobacter sp. NicSoilB4]|nr:hypothetical protein NicSoilB4_17680 [Arthrobacter sp. NicSoilB4]
MKKNYDDAFDQFTRGIIDSDQLAAAKAKLQEQLDQLGPHPQSQGQLCPFRL